jgi:hypothetical protein
MATPGFGQLPVTNSNADVEQKLRVEHALKGSASWFILVGVLSLVNSVLGMAGAKIQFIFGLGITQVVDAISHQAGSAGQVLDLVINGMIAGVFALFWHFAKKGARWAWITGMALYLLDGLILLPFGDYLGLAFHAYVLYRLYSGFKLLPEYQRLAQPPMTGTISASL